MRNGQNVGGAYGSKLGVCQEIIYTIGRDKRLWRFTGSSWLRLNGNKIPCE